MRSIKTYTKIHNKHFRGRLFLVFLSFIILFSMSAYTEADTSHLQNKFPVSVPQHLNFKFYRPVIDLDLVDWLHWFGPTVFSYEEGDFWDYTDYCQGQHCGIDFGADWGTPIYAGIFGEVYYASNQRIEIWYGEESGKAWWKIVYMNIADIYVKPGDYVTPNTMIGTVGNHRNNPYAGGIFVDHIHLEVRFDPDPNKNFKSEFYNPLTFFYDQSIYEKLNEIAKRQFASNDWFYMRDVLLMGIDHPEESQIIKRGDGKMEKTWFSWQGNRIDYYLKSYYIREFPGPILYP